MIARAVTARSVWFSTTLEDSHRARDRAQRVAQLVPEHRQELVLGLIRRFRRGGGRRWPPASARLRSDTSTAVVRAVTDIVARKICDRSKALLRTSLVKGPDPVSIPHVANADSRTVAVAVSRGPNRKAAHSSGGRHRKSSGKLLSSAERSKTTSPTRTSEPSRTRGLDDLLTSPPQNPVPGPEHDERGEDEIAGGIA